MRRKSSSGGGGSSSTSCCSTSWSGMSNYMMMMMHQDHDDDDDDHLELGLSINTHSTNNNNNNNNNNNSNNGNASLFVKVYMEGHPIGRKLDMMSISGYSHLIATLDRMFNANILSDSDSQHSYNHHVLTYEDEEGDWMMVGDVPWELFLSAVKRLKISRACPTS